MKKTFQYHGPAHTLFGMGVRNDLKKILPKLGFHKALVVCGQTIPKIGTLAQITDILDEINMEYAVFAGVQPNPTVKIVMDGVKMLEEEKCDFIISIGGGSSHDAAKGIGVVATNGGDMADYISKRVENPMLPLIAINTTAGTGSECTHSSVVTDEATGVKFGMKSTHLLPLVAVNDYELMMTMPKGVAAGTGMDALTHAIEAHVNVTANTMSDELGYSAMRLVFDYLPESVNEGTEEARGKMAVAAYLAGLSFGNAGVGIVHSMSHQLSSVYDLPHGLCNAIILPVGMAYNAERSETVVGQYAEVAQILFGTECVGKSPQEQCAYLISRVEQLSQEVGTKVTLSSLGVKEEDIPLLAKKTLEDNSLPNSPVQPTAEEVEVLYRKLM